MAGLGPDLQDCFGDLRASRKFDDSYKTSNIFKMAANFKLQVCHSHFSEAITLNLYLTELP